MVTPQHETTTADELALSQRLVAEINKLIGGRTTAEAIALLAAVNAGLASCHQHTEIPAEPITVH